MKLNSAFFSISEVATLLKLPQHTLRYWEKHIQQISPLKRKGGRRYYRTNDVQLLQGVQTYLAIKGNTISKLLEVLEARGVKYFLKEYPHKETQKSNAQNKPFSHLQKIAPSSMLSNGSVAASSPHTSDSISVPITRGSYHFYPLSPKKPISSNIEPSNTLQSPAKNTFFELETLRRSDLIAFVVKSETPYHRLLARLHCETSLQNISHPHQSIQRLTELRHRITSLLHTHQSND